MIDTCVVAVAPAPRQIEFEPDLMVELTFSVDDDTVMLAYLPIDASKDLLADLVDSGFEVRYTE